MKSGRELFGSTEPTLMEIVVTAEERSPKVAADTRAYIFWSGLLQYNRLPLNFYAKIEANTERYRRILIGENAQDIAQNIMDAYAGTTPIRRTGT